MGLESIVWEQLRIRSFSLHEILLPLDGLRDGLPDRLTVTVDHEGRSHSLDLERNPVRSDGFRLLVQKADGSLEETPAPPPRTYRGRVRGQPGSIVSASLLPSGLRATVVPPKGPAWSVRPLAEVLGDAPRSRHVVYYESDLELPDLAGDTLEAPLPVPSYGSEGTPSGEAKSSETDGELGSGAAGGVCTLKVADIAFDSDYEFYDRICGQDTDLCVSTIEEGLNTTNLIYIRDVKIIHRLSTIIVREDPDADFYAQFPDASDFGAMLVAFRSEWNDNRTDIDRDMAYYVTGKTDPEYGGLAYVNTVCSSYAYGMGLGYWGYAAILRHELGHNWSAGHSCGNESGYIMCGNSIDAISGYNIEKMTEHRDSRSCLDEMQYTAPDEPPYVRPDPVQTVEGQGPLFIEVLRNDTDSNCDTLSIVSYPERSAFGAELTPADSLAEDRFDGLLYLPRSGFVGTDTFGYTVADGSGFEVPCTVTIEVRPRGIMGYWAFEETGGEDLLDSSGAGHDGELRGALSLETASVPGHFGQALQFTGDDDDYISVEHHPELDLRRGLTVTAWFAVDSFDNDGEQLVAKGSSAWRLKRDGTRNALKFTCSGLSGGEVRGSQPVNDGEWHHAAGVYDGSRIYLYLDGELDGSAPATGLISTNTSSVHIGDNSFHGRIDEVRLYNHPLTAGEIRTLHLATRVDNPWPRDGSTGATPGVVLGWLGSPAFQEYDVYLGTGRSGVALAVPGSPEHLGRVSGTAHAPELESATTYFWRVDAAGASQSPGSIWSFTTSFAHTDFDEPPLNASSFTPGVGDSELGFSSEWSATDGESPFIGVIETSSTPTTPVFSHRSVRARTTLEPVELTDRGEVAVSLLLQARDTGYESEDFLEVYATDGNQRIDLLRVDGTSGLNHLAEKGYGSFQALVPPDWDHVSVVLDSSSNSSQGSERYDFDSVAVSCAASYAVLAHTRFEEATPGADSYQPGAGASELGFQTSWTATSGLSPRASVVTAADSAGTRFLSHRSVRATTTFDTVPVDGSGQIEAWALVRVQDTGYEDDDFLEVYVTNGTERAHLVDAGGDSGLDSLEGDTYRAYGVKVPPEWSTARLVVNTRSDSSTGSESYDLCAVEFLRLEAGSPCDAGPTDTTFLRGDANSDGEVNLSDGIRVLNVLFLGGTPLDCVDAGDTDDSGTLDISDGIAVFNFLFLGGPAPRAPGHLLCGPDLTEDLLGCDAYSPCQ